MKKIGLFYITESVKTANTAILIKQTFGQSAKIDIIPIEDVWQKDFEKYKNLIVGTSTWLDGELPVYWDEILEDIRSLNLSGHKVAIFGLGDQKNYPDNFVDGIGILAEAFEKTGADLVGQTSAEGYIFNESLALNDNQFDGLAIDVDNQADLTTGRIKTWVEQLKKEFL